MIATLIFLIIYFGLIGIVIAGTWKTFVKAGRPGWEAIIPIYNLWIMVTEIERPEDSKKILHFVLCVIPFVNIVGLIIVAQGIAKRFGKSSGFGILLAFLPFIGYPILGFGSAQYDAS